MIDAQFDSDILIDALRGVEAARTEIRRAGRKSISRVSWTEVMAATDPASLKTVEAFLSCFQIEEIGDGVARRAAALRAERKGLTLADAFVLATAQLSGRILVTRNIKVFPAAMPGIRVPYTL
ncbi:PIN domain-containing protein [Sphingopyxis sp. XHP0097]|jgi:predicted nucleic acid-binding protein|uniref:PIN domain-containing protein n=1 Tax=Sphingopyxis jiangsuensis TaxID=2871171 RepID=A0ABS7MFU6_9SPHN|nr:MULTISPECIES: PIN domain-containing protein [Sphingopyxis]MBY4636931.1 PIN domain-containing protein [Sphingopyxis jiangsuensis]